MQRHAISGRILRRSEKEHHAIILKFMEKCFATPYIDIFHMHLVGVLPVTCKAAH